MNILGKKESTSHGEIIVKASGRKKGPPPPPQDVYFFCNACGNKFKAGRDDARFCSDICRSAAHSVCKNIIIVPHKIDENQAKLYDEIVVKLKEDSGIIRRAIFTNNGDGIFSQIKKEMHKSGEPEIDAQIEKQEEEHYEKIAASRGAKIEKTPKNDHNLIPGKTGKEQEKLSKKKEKENKKNNKK